MVGSVNYRKGSGTLDGRTGRPASSHDDDDPRGIWREGQRFSEENRPPSESRREPRVHPPSISVNDRIEAEGGGDSRENAAAEVRLTQEGRNKAPWGGENSRGEIVEWKDTTEGHYPTGSVLAQHEESELRVRSLATPIRCVSSSIGTWRGEQTTKRNTFLLLLLGAEGARILSTRSGPSLRWPRTSRAWRDTSGQFEQRKRRDKISSRFDKRRRKRSMVWRSESDKRRRNVNSVFSRKS